MKEAWSAHGHVRSRLHCKFGRWLWAKKWLLEGVHPKDKRTGAGEAMRAMVFGRLLFEKEQAPPSRFVRQFLGASMLLVQLNGKHEKMTIRPSWLPQLLHTLGGTRPSAPHSFKGAAVVEMAVGGPSDEYPHVALEHNERGPV